jgi:flagellar biosynthesis protein FlhB
MAEEDQDQKTEQPTGKRLEEARSRGQLPVSREIGYLFSFLGIYITVKWLAPGMTVDLMSHLRVFLESPDAFTVDDHGLQTLVFDTVVQVAMATGLVFLVMVILILAGYISQTGLFVSTELIVPKLDKLSLVAGIKRLFSGNSLVELVKSFGKLVVLGGVVFFVLSPLVQQLPGFTGRPLMDSVGFLHQQAVHLILVLMLVFGVIAFGDLFYQRFTYIKNLKMTKTEVKDEYKQQEGDPMIKGRLRQIRLEKARKRMMAQVPKADVVITNPTHYAVALKYDGSKSAAPVVLAKGIDRIAERIRAVAEENKITLVSNPPLARTLYDTVEIDKEIPAQLYRAVAEVISYVYKLKKKRI